MKIAEKFLENFWSPKPAAPDVIGRLVIGPPLKFEAQIAVYSALVGGLVGTASVISATTSLSRHISAPRRIVQQTPPDPLTLLDP